MKTIKLYYNTKKEPIQVIKSEGGALMKHQIASAILLTADQYELKKIRVTIEDEGAE